MEVALELCFRRKLISGLNSRLALLGNCTECLCKQGCLMEEPGHLLQHVLQEGGRWLQLDLVWRTRSWELPTHVSTSALPSAPRLQSRQCHPPRAGASDGACGLKRMA